MQINPEHKLLLIRTVLVTAAPKTHILWHSMHQDPFSTDWAGKPIRGLAFYMPPMLYPQTLLHALM